MFDDQQINEARWSWWLSVDKFAVYGGQKMLSGASDFLSSARGKRTAIFSCFNFYIEKLVPEKESLIL